MAMKEHVEMLISVARELEDEDAISLLDYAQYLADRKKKQVQRQWERVAATQPADDFDLSEEEQRQMEDPEGYIHLRKKTSL